MIASNGWPWWIAPLYIFGKILYFVTYPVAVLPFQATCHVDLWGNEPPYSCASYWCPKIRAENPERLPDWPQCNE